MSVNFTQQTLFVDAGVANYQDLIDGTNLGTEVIVLETNRSGIEQISQALAARHNLERMSEKQESSRNDTLSITKI